MQRFSQRFSVSWTKVFKNRKKPIMLRKKGKRYPTPLSLRIKSKIHPSLRI